MEHSWNTFQTAYLTADEQTKAIIDSEHIGNAVATLVNEGIITDAQQVIVLRVFPLVVLQALTPEQAVEELTNQGVEQAATAVQKLQASLASAAVATAQPEAAPTADEPTHTSSQEALLNESKRRAASDQPPASQSGWDVTS